MKLKEIRTNGAIVYPKPANNILEFDPESLRTQKQDEHWVLIDNGGFWVARCSLWWCSTPQYPGQRLGIFGHYAADDDAAAREMLKHACLRLQQEGCTMAVGPMDGNIWRSYRLITHDGGEPPFLLEPNTPLEWSYHLRDFGFTETARYFSAINTCLSQEDPNYQHAAQYVNRQGIVIRNVDTYDLYEELNRVYEISTLSFQHSSFYTQLGRRKFHDIYFGLKAFIEPELVFIAECRGKPIGFIFAVPDLLQAQREQEVDTVIVKTVAILPARNFAGTGIVLAGRVQQAGRELGYKKVIHALMREGSVSGAISSRTARPFRRYALYAKQLGKYS